MIGSSLVLCLRDMVHNSGKFPFNRVEMIYSGTNFKSQEDVLEAYRNLWNDDIKKVEHVLGKLWNTGCICQLGKDKPPYAGKHWYKNQKEFEYIQIQNGFFDVVDAIYINRINELRKLAKKYDHD